MLLDIELLLYKKTREKQLLFKVSCRPSGLIKGTAY